MNEHWFVLWFLGLTHHTIVVSSSPSFRVPTWMLFSCGELTPKTTVKTNFSFICSKAPWDTSNITIREVLFSPGSRLPACSCSEPNIRTFFFWMEDFLLLIYPSTRKTCCGSWGVSIWLPDGVGSWSRFKRTNYSLRGTSSYFSYGIVQDTWTWRGPPAFSEKGWILSGTLSTVHFELFVQTWKTAIFVGSGVYKGGGCEVNLASEFENSSFGTTKSEWIWKRVSLVENWCIKYEWIPKWVNLNNLGTNSEWILPNFEWICWNLDVFSWRYALIWLNSLIYHVSSLRSSLIYRWEVS